jgi:hypothetical protein
MDHTAGCKSRALTAEEVDRAEAALEEYERAGGVPLDALKRQLLD